MGYISMYMIKNTIFMCKGTFFMDISIALTIWNMKPYRMRGIVHNYKWLQPQPHNYLTGHQVDISM